jgi:hypothetical protein
MGLDVIGMRYVGCGTGISQIKVKGIEPIRPSFYDQIWSHLWERVA